MLERWAEYFDQLCQIDPPTFNMDVGSVKNPVLTPSIIDDLPFLPEVRIAVSELRSSKAAGICGIPAKQLKASGEPAFSNNNNDYNQNNDNNKALLVKTATIKHEQQ